MSVDLEKEVQKLIEEQGMTEEQARAVVYEPPYDVVYGPDGEPLQPEAPGD